MIISPGTTIHVDWNVHTRVAGRGGLGIGRVVTVRRISRVLSMRLHNNRHIGAMVRHKVGSRVRHGTIGEVRVILVGGERVARTLVLLAGMRRRGLHRDVVRGVVRGSFTRLGHAGWHRRILSVERNRVTDRAHERRGRWSAARRGNTRECHTDGWRWRRVRLSLGRGSRATS